MTDAQKICSATPQSDLGERALEYCLSVDDGSSDPSINAALKALDHAIDGDNPQEIESAAENLHDRYMEFYAAQKKESETTTKNLKTARDVSFGIAGLGVSTAGSIALVLAAPGIIAGATALGVKALPLLATSGLFLQRMGAPITAAYSKVESVVTPVISRPLPLLTQLNALPGLHSLMQEPNLRGLNRAAMTVYGAVAVYEVLEHADDEPDAAAAKMPLEDIFGRTTTMAYGNLSISYLMLSRLPSLLGAIGQRFAWPPMAVTLYTAGHLVSEYFVQNESSGVELDEMDGVRTWGGNLAAATTMAPLKGLQIFWYGAYSLLPATTGFVLSSGAINSLLFLPIGQWFERANLGNYWEGLTIREFSLALPRKIVQGIAGPTTPLGLTVYYASKAVENYYISRHYSFFAGKGRYREPLHRFLSKKHTWQEFADFCKKGLGSERFMADRAFKLEIDDYLLLGKDMSSGEFSPAEISAIKHYLDDIIQNGTNRDDLDAANGWMAVFKITNNPESLKAALEAINAGTTSLQEGMK